MKQFEFTHRQSIPTLKLKFIWGLVTFFGAFSVSVPAAEPWEVLAIPSRVPGDAFPNADWEIGQIRDEHGRLRVTIRGGDTNTRGWVIAGRLFNIPENREFRLLADFVPDLPDVSTYSDLALFLFTPQQWTQAKEMAQSANPSVQGRSPPYTWKQNVTPIPPSRDLTVARHSYEIARDRFTSHLLSRFPGKTMVLAVGWSGGALPEGSISLRDTRLLTMERPAVRVSLESELPAILVTLLLPYKGALPPEVTLTLKDPADLGLEAAEGVRVIQVKQPGAVDTLVSFSEASSFASSEASVAAFQREAGDWLTVQEEITAPLSRVDGGVR